MKFTMPDGSTLETENPAEIEQVSRLMGWKAPEKTHADLLRDALAEAKPGRNELANPPGPETRQWLRDDAAVMPEEAAVEPQKAAVALLDKPAEELPAPAKMPKHVELPPKAYVTQAQMLVVELLRHYPLGLSTKQIAEKLRWDGPKSSRITTYLVRNESGAVHPIVTKVPGHKRYVLTPHGQQVRYEIVNNPSTYREHR